jgi:hypothetical protein
MANSITQCITTIFFTLVCTLLYAQKKQVSNSLPYLIFSNTNQAKIKVGEKIATNWGIDPKIKPDIYEVACKGTARTKVQYITDIDSITYNIAEGEIINFLVVLNGRDTAYTQFKGINIPKAAKFSYAYQKKNNNTYEVFVPEIKELFMILACITNTGLADTKSYIINHDTTQYYSKMLDWFLPYKNEKIVIVIDSLLKRDQYINLKADACAFKFTGNKIVINKTYHRHNGAGSNRNYLAPHVPLLEEFARKSNFRKFYQSNQYYYDSLIIVHKKIVPVKQMWKWLESHFPIKYNAYKVYFSPLVRGNHSTSNAEDNGFKETNMFIRAPYTIANVSPKVMEALLSRITFTEIDHNYVNPASTLYLSAINQIFSDRAFGTAGKESNGYRDPYNLFNEYMTWALFLVYCADFYSGEDFFEIKRRTVAYKVNTRGFSKFGEFSEALLALYTQRNKNEPISALYPKFLNLCKTFFLQTQLAAIFKD